MPSLLFLEPHCELLVCLEVLKLLSLLSQLYLDILLPRYVGVVWLYLHHNLWRLNLLPLDLYRRLLYLLFFTSVRGEVGSDESA